MTGPGTENHSLTCKVINFGLVSGTLKCSCFQIVDIHIFTFLCTIQCMAFLLILPNLNTLRTLEVYFFVLLFPEIS